MAGLFLYWRAQPSRSEQPVQAGENSAIESELSDVVTAIDQQQLGGLAGELVIDAETGCCKDPSPRYQTPSFGIEAQGSRAGKAVPRCNNSTEMPSGERMNAMRPSRGGRLIVTPDSRSFSHSA